MRASRRLGVRAGVPVPAGGQGAGLVHAPGGTLPARVPGRPGRREHPRRHPQPELAAELTLQPVRRYGVDAAILFTDIVVPAAAVGFGVEVEQGRGPVVSRPFRQAEDLARLRPLEPEADTGYVLETVRLVARELDPLGIPLIGFAGAPFTVASYLSRGARRASTPAPRRSCGGTPTCGPGSSTRLADMALASLRAQVLAGASAVQLFDSWVGALSPADYERHVLPATRKVFAGLADLGVPRIHFGVGTGELLALMAGAGAEVVGVDWRVPLDEARRRVGPGPRPAGQPRPHHVSGAVGRRRGRDP